MKSILKTATKNNIVALHKFIFQHEGDRNNRKRLREFEGFDFTSDDESYELKRQYVYLNLRKNEIISICVMLGLNFDVQDLFAHIFNNLQKGNLLSQQDVIEEDEEEMQQQEEENNEEEVDDENESDNASANNDDVSNKNKFESTKYDDAQSHLSRASSIPGSCASTSQKNSYNRQHGFKNTMSRFTLNFRDIEDSVRTFNGDNTISIELWIEEFEETATAMRWDEFQKFVFGKKLLKGLAALFIKSERGITSWPKLKLALMNEFQEKISSEKIHKELTERKANKGEPLQEY